jgi:hypothetical protein
VVGTRGPALSMPGSRGWDRPGVVLDRFARGVRQAGWAQAGSEARGADAHDAASQNGTSRLKREPRPAWLSCWTASGGSIDAAGRFVAPADSGFFTVHALAGVLEATTDVRVAADGPTPPPPLGTSVMRWSGMVPPQKWMNFYTKVVSRFATTPGLTLTVGLEVPVPPEQAKSKADETKTALRELGLPDDVI